MASAYEIYKEGGLLNSRYQKLEDISEGAYGIVSLAKDIHRSKLVAVKYIFKLDDDKPTAFRDQHRFSKSIKQMNDDICEEALHEIAIHEKLGYHRNIISFLDCFDSFIILEYCPRGDLYEAIHDGIGPKSTRDIVNLVIQLMGAVEFAHSKSIYHRDIKPENILIADDWSIRLSDWGLASTSRYCNDFGVGSEKYMAPELFDEKTVQVYDASKIDIWSIGICLLNLVFQKSPFRVANSNDKSFSYFACNREALFDIFYTMSMDLFAVLRYSLTIDPDNRDLELMKEQLLNVQSLTIDDDLESITKEEDIVHQEVKPIIINDSLKTSNPAEISKSFAISTPNFRINDHFKDFKRDQFNRKDYFTPPAMSAHYMDNYEKSKKGIYQPPHQRPQTKKSTFHNNNNSYNHFISSYSSMKKKPRKRGGSFNSFSSNSGKYVPPNLRPVYKSPLHSSSHNDAIVFDDDDDDDELFVLEEDDHGSRKPQSTRYDDLDTLKNAISTLNIEDNYSSDASSTPSLAVSNNSNARRPGLIDKPVDERGNSTSSTSSSSSDPCRETKKVYVPPHHRSNFQSALKKPWKFTNTYSNNNHYNHTHFTPHTRRHSTTSSLKRELFSNSAPHHRSDWIHSSKLESDYGEDDEDEDDFQPHNVYNKFATRVGVFGGHHSHNLKSGFSGNTGKLHDVRESTREIIH